MLETLAQKLLHLMSTVSYISTIYLEKYVDIRRMKLLAQVSDGTPVVVQVVGTEP